MKKIMKRFTVLMVVCLAFLGAGTVALASAGYITWGGSDDYRLTIDIFEGLKDGIEEQNKSITNLTKEKENLTNEKEKLTKEKENLNTELSEVRVNLTGKESELKAAYETIDRMELEQSNAIKYVKGRTEEAIQNANQHNGLRHKYDALQGPIDDLAAYLDIDERLGNTEMYEEESELNQAEKDMQHIREEAEKLEKTLNSSSDESAE